MAELTRFSTMCIKK